MHVFWKHIIEPVLRIRKPRHIVEIGADHGLNTANILEYCRQTGAFAHIIEPQPKFDPAEIRREYGNIVSFYTSMSLNSIPLVDRMDAVLIDGDHNWYTVINELRLIEKRAIAKQFSFPVVFLHDIGWPYGRRDLYYNPETIPDAYTKAYAKKGVDPDATGLQAEGGFNPHLFHSIYENNLQNGVLTAVEDFMEESSFELELLQIQGFHGLGLLFERNLLRNQKLKEFLGGLDISEPARALLADLEKSRLRDLIDLEENRRQLRDAVAENKRASEEFSKRRRQFEKLKTDQESRIAALETQRADQRKRIGEMEAARARLETEMARLQNSKEQLENELQRSLEDQKKAQEQGRREKERFYQFLAQIEDQFEKVMQSRRWKIGDAAVTALTLSRWRKRGSHPVAVDHIRRIFSELQAARDNGAPERRNTAQREVSAGETRLRRHGKHDLTVAVIAWDVGHNPLGRAYMLAEALSRHFHVLLLGPSFPRYNTDVWKPLKNSAVEVFALPGRTFPDFLAVLEKAAPRIEADIILSCKARLPSVQLGLMMKAFRNRPLFVDVDDYELSFFKNRKPLGLAGLKESIDTLDLETPFEETWTRFTENLLGYADGLLVSNPALQRKFGGTLVPHARDEQKFDPALYSRETRRRELGIDSDARVVLFLGTPRQHKGVLEVLNAVLAHRNPQYKLCIIGTPPDRQYAKQLKQAGGKSLILLPDQPFEKLPDNLVIADLVCLIQDPASEISNYQLPAKIVDAISMGLPVLASPTEPIRPLIEAGAVEPVDRQDLARQIDQILSHPEAYRKQQSLRREIFLQQYSYAAIADTLCALFLNALHELRALPANALSFVEIQRSLPSETKADGKASGWLDLVVFWKQNDTGIYGRRSDMLIKYLEKRPEIRRIAVFDMPVEISELRRKGASHGLLQDRLVYHETYMRNWGVRDTEKTSFQTFVYSGDRKNEDSRKLWRFPEKRAYVDYIRERLRSQDIDPGNAVFWFYPYNPHTDEILKGLKPRWKVIDLVDDNRTWYNNHAFQRDEISRHYREVLRKADLVFANCENVRASMSAYHNDIKLIPNGCETGEPTVAPGGRDNTAAITSLKGPKVGYVGNMEKDKIDAELIAHIASQRPDWNILLIGSTHANPNILELDQYPNIHFMGVVRYPEVRLWLKELDVAILPHVDTEKTRSMNPLKLYVYCAVGLPVVASNVMNLDELENHIAVAESYEDFVKKVDQALANPRKHISRDLKACLENNTWERRVEQIMGELMRITAR